MASHTADKIREDPKMLAAEIDAGLAEIHEFVMTEPFIAVLEELYGLPEAERHQFVLDVLIVPAEMEKRGVFTPSPLNVQRSTFEDGRPTLFCVTKQLANYDRKVTITFDNPI